MDGTDTVEALAVRELGEEPDDDDDVSEVSQMQFAPRPLHAREHTIAEGDNRRRRRRRHGQVWCASGVRLSVLVI
jgi:hypothetical protein